MELEERKSFFFHVTAVFNHFLLLADFLSLLRYRFLPDAIVVVFTTVLFLTQMPVHFSLSLSGKNLHLSLHMYTAGTYPF